MYMKPEVKSRMEQTKDRFKNAYKPWTDEDDTKLSKLFCEGKTSRELSEAFQRNIGAINSRIEKFELKQKYR